MPPPPARRGPDSAAWTQAAAARRVRPSGGGTALVTLAAVLLTVAGAALPRLARRDGELARVTLHVDRAEAEVRAALGALELELAGARGWSPRASLLRPLEAAETRRLSVSTTRGFPDAGLLLLSRGTAAEERVGYTGTVARARRFVLLSRGRQCTQPAFHPAGAEVLWSGLAEALAQQDPPPPARDFDGVALEAAGPLFFRGDGTGLSYRVPDEPAGAGPGGPPGPEAGSILYFAPDLELSEREARRDLNGDGDLADRFDLGQLRKRAWDPADRRAPAREVGLGPRSVLQERCNWGGDLDADGFDDPLFLWDATSRRLHVRLFVLGRSDSGAAVVRRVESHLSLPGDPGR